MRILTSDVGGAFGCKEQPYPEDIAVLHAARLLGRPVKWSGTRAEHFLSDNHARDAVIEAALALDANGKFLAIKAAILDGIGAYCSCHGAHISIRNTTNGLPLMYDVPLLDVEIRLVLTNTAPIGPYRGAGREQASYITERLVDQAARARHRSGRSAPTKSHFDEIDPLQVGLRANLRQWRFRRPAGQSPGTCRLEWIRRSGACVDRKRPHLWAVDCLVSSSVWVPIRMKVQTSASSRTVP